MTIEVHEHMVGIAVTIYVDGRVYFRHNSQASLERNVITVIRSIIRVGHNGYDDWIPEILWFLENQSCS